MAATRKFLEGLGSAVHPSNLRKIGPFSVGSIGVGCYRMKMEHVPMIAGAVTKGMNFIDTAAHYEDGASEVAVGAALQILQQNSIPREACVVCTKYGHLEGRSLAKYQAAPPAPYHDDMVQYSQVSWHCISPAYLEAELEGSEKRMGGASPDMVLLHNPEFFLSQCKKDRVPVAEAHDEMYARITKAFTFFEQQIEQGRIKSYGVSTNTRSCFFSVSGGSNVYESMDVERLVLAARDAATAVGKGISEHGMAAIQLPLNLVESGAVLGRPLPKYPHAAAPPCLPLAQRLGVAVISNRPLNAIPPSGAAPSDGSWGQHVRLAQRPDKPASATVAIFSKAIGAVVPGGSELSLQEAALRVASGTPGVDVALVGVRQREYVEQAAAVLAEERIPEEAAIAAYRAARQGLEDMQVKHETLW